MKLLRFIRDIFLALFLVSYLLIVLFCCSFYKEVLKQQTTVRAIDTVTVSTAERWPVYTRTQINYFLPGDTLTTKENGALTLWDSTTARTLIVGYVTDSGTFKTYSE